MQPMQEEYSVVVRQVSSNAIQARRKERIRRITQRLMKMEVVMTS